MKNKLKILFCMMISAAVIFSLISATALTVCAESDINDIKQEYVVFTEKNIKTEDMRKKSDLSEDTLSEYLRKFPSLSGIEYALIEAQEDYNVNAILILAIIRLESGNGKSQLAKSKNNLGGLKAAAVYKSFDSKSDCVTYMAKLISDNYLTEGGKYYNGYTLNDIAKCYSVESETWSDLVKELIYEIQITMDEL